MSDFGAQLKEAREQRGISLRQISTATKISMAALEALERNDFSRLPGGIFSRAFVRAYALEVGLDPEQTVQEFLVEYEQNDLGAAEKAPPEVTADDRAFLERQRRAAWWLRVASLLILLLAALGLLAWQVRARNKAVPPSDEAASAAELPPPSRAPAVAPPAAAPPPPPTPVTTPVVAPKAAPAADQVALRLQASDDCWTRVTVDGNLIFEQILRAGDVREIRPGRDVRVQLGNAGALRWTINGQPAKALGKAGQTADVHVSRANLSTYLN